MRIAIDLALISDGISMESKRAIIDMTTSSSTRLKPRKCIFGGALEWQGAWLGVLHLVLTLSKLQKEKA
jgi:hypothetical protein